MKKIIAASVFMMFFVFGNVMSAEKTFQQCVLDLQNNPKDNSLREKIIKLAQGMKPALVIPAEAEKFANRAEYVINTAKSPADLTDAIKEYEKALFIAPWVSRYYYNLGVAYEKTGQLQEAVRNYKLFLLTKPSPKDTKEVQKQIDGLEYAIEKAVGWVIDPANGAKVGWGNSNFTLKTVSWSGPVVEEKAEGKGTLKVTITDKEGKELNGWGEVEMVGGLLDGKGSMEWSDNHSYNGYFKAGKRNGKGVMKLSNGNVYDGEWKDDLQVAVPNNVEKVLDIPWEASENEVKHIMLSRPETSYRNGSQRKSDNCQTYIGPYNGEPVLIQINFYQGKMYAVLVLNGVSGDQVMNKFEVLKQGLSQRYGPPMSAGGTGLSSTASWDLGGVHRLIIEVLKSPEGWADRWPKNPYQVIIQYSDSKIDGEVNHTSGPSSNKDY